VIQRDNLPIHNAIRKLRACLRGRRKLFRPVKSLARAQRGAPAFDASAVFASAGFSLRVQDVMAETERRSQRCVSSPGTQKFREPPTRERGRIFHETVLPDRRSRVKVDRDHA